MISLDTSAAVDLIRENASRTPGPATARLREIGVQPMGLSVFALCELEAGALGARDPRAEQGLVRALASQCQLFYPDGRFAPLYADVLTHLLARGRPPGTMDLLIGLSALIAGTPLLTGDARGFANIPGLRVETYGRAR